ncbi:acetyl-CoA synthetase-like protein [Jackrogersella minutella]|nr:acetyl-CoA synthetase-like protein [Jackrogersella minutella]
MANISPELVEERIDKFGKDDEQVPILGYPRHENDAAAYECFTGKDLDRMVDQACRVLLRAGIEVNSRMTVALFALSDLLFVIAFFALSRLGCKVLTMSIRLDQPAYIHLLGRANCDAILYRETVRISSTIADIKEVRPDLLLVPMPAREDFDRTDETEHAQMTLMMHSSGSTGLPKPLFLSHKSLLTSIVLGIGLIVFNALPWYHLHGLITSFQAIWMRKPAHLFNAHLPLTADNLISALKQDGIDVLKRCKFVTSAVARTPDELGNRVVEAGVKLGVLLGLTEVGHVGDSIHREPWDDSWDYMGPYANLREHMTFKKLDDGVYESVYLKSHPALMGSNSNDPPGSFHSGDLFTPHPTIDWAWKYVARADDRITLISGEKILPVNMEGTIRESPLVRDVLIIGNDRLVPSLLAFRSTTAYGLTDDELVEAIQPYMESANLIADEIARLTPDMIAPLGVDVEYPATDKNNIIRSAAYAQFEDVIEALYSKDKGAVDGRDGKNLKFDVEQLEQFVLSLIREQSGIEVPDVHADLWVDSLRAAQVRRLLQRDLDLAGHSLREQIEDFCRNDKIEILKMEKIIDDHGKFRPRTHRGVPTPMKQTVTLTGTTGALGAHLLSQLLNDPDIAHVFCLVRGNDAPGRINESLKLTALTTNGMGAPNLGLSPEDYAVLQKSATLIIHGVWPVNFNISLTSLVPHIAGLRNLLDLSLRVPFRDPARLIFASSISTAFQTPTPANVPEAPILSLNFAAATGYALEACSATEVHALPRLEGDHDTCDWMPVDTVARTCLQLPGTLDPKAAGATFYNVRPPHAFSWNRDFLPALREAGFEFEDVSLEQWLKRLRSRAEDLGPAAETRLPAVKLVDYYVDTYGGLGVGSGSGLRFDIQKACNDSGALNMCPQVLDTDLVPKMLRHWLGDAVIDGS